MNTLLEWRRLLCTFALSIFCAVASANASCQQGESDDDDELSTVLISSTRIPRLIGDEPLKVEAVPAEEIAENSTVRPGDVTSLLVELSGVRFEASSAGLGATGLRLRGFPARHALVLLDGLPLASEATASFGLLQFPPLDLQRVEVIKGSANSLYGQDALAGVLNLVSMPSQGPSIVMTDLGSGGADNVTAFLRPEDSQSPESSLLLYRSRQTRGDPDKDGWTEIAGYHRYGARPRLTLRSAEGRYVYLTVGASSEDRRGGTLAERWPRSAGFPLTLNTRRRDAGVIARLSPADEPATMMRASFSQDQNVRQAGTRVDNYTYRNDWFEVTKASKSAVHEWVFGASAQRNDFEFRHRRDLQYSRKFIGLFAEDAYHASERFSLHVSGRREWGDFDGRDSFRLAALYRRNSTWGVRMSVGGGQAVPGYAVPELSDYGPGAITRNLALKKESAITTSLDIDWHPEDIELNVGIFDGQIKRALGLRSSGNELEIFNRSGVLEFKGIESTLRFVEGPWHVIGSWTLLDVARRENGLRSRLAYVPKNTGELAVLYEVPNTWRAGIEFSYSGSQIIEEVGLTRAPATLEVSMLLAKSFRELTLFVNAMNLTDVRQTKRFRLLRPDAAQSQIPVNEAWGSLTGRVVNVGLRREF